MMSMTMSMFFAIIIFLYLFSSTSGKFTQRDAIEEQVEVTCSMEKNQTVRESFRLSVREKHGINGNYRGDRHALVSDQFKSQLTCFSQYTCGFDSNYTWCINVYHPTEEIELCYSSITGGLINATDHALLLGLDSMFSIPDRQDCRVYRPGCMQVQIPYYLRRSYLTCTSESATRGCYKKEFLEVQISVASYVTASPVVMIANQTNELILGETNIYLCITTFETLNENGNPYSAWLVGDRNFSTINEDPFCQDYNNPNCSQDAHDGAIKARSERIRVYQRSFHAHRFCPEHTELTLHTWIVIDNARVEDAQAPYTCLARQWVINPYSHSLSDNKTLVLNPVTRLQEVKEIKLPQINSSGVIYYELGEEIEMTVSVEAGEGDKLVWMLNGSPIEVTDEEYSCSDAHRDQLVFSTPVIVEEVGRFKRNFTSTLHICGMDSSTAGLYECVVDRPRGENITIWSGNISLTLQTATEEGATSSHLAYIISVPVTLFILVLIALVLLVVIRCAKNRRKTHQETGFMFRSGLILEGKDLGGREHDNKYKLLYCDPLEFPRNKLVLFDTPLGEGTFGLVLQAKAEGIVEGSPERNIVAVKTVRAKAPMDEVYCLWDELQLMKRMEPHENIVNLLAHCTTQDGPLYLLLEYAVHGSLKDFLHECEIAVKKLNHTPHVSRWRNRTPSARTCSVSSTYPLLAEKTPLSAQNSVFSPVDTPTTIVGGNNNHKGGTFEFPLSAAHQMKMRERLVTQDSGVFSDTNSLDAHNMACVKEGVNTPMAHTVAPLTHDYINSKGLIYMEDVYNFALQIACGLQHLENIGIVHCDLAARNILIAEGFVLKIGDFGMARDVSDTEYYRKEQGRIPVKWTAPEALQEHIFTHMSDIWSYGVVLWEIFSYGNRPYSQFKIHHTWDKFIQHLKDGNRLSQPEGCPDEFYQVMLNCWNLAPDSRPTATDLVRILSNDTCSTESPENISMSSSISEPLEMPIKKPLSDISTHLPQENYTETVV